MNWTTTKPTVPGWYWWRRDHRSTHEVIKVGEEVGDRVFLLSLQAIEEAVRGEWAGPLGLPEEGMPSSTGLSWTMEKPMKAGWHWYRYDEESEATVMNVHKDNDELFWRGFPGQWAGPLEVPV